MKKEAIQIDQHEADEHRRKRPRHDAASSFARWLMTPIAQPVATSAENQGTEEAQNANTTEHHPHHRHSPPSSSSLATEGPSSASTASACEELENNMTVNAFPKAPPGFPPCDSRRNGQLSPRDRPMTLEGHEIGSRTKNPSKGSPFHTSPRATQANDNDLDCDKAETRVEDGSSARVTSFPQLAQVVEEMQKSLTRMQGQVDRMTEQVGGFAQRLEVYDDHFAAMRRQLDYYFPYPPPPPPRSQ